MRVESEFDSAHRVSREQAEKIFNKHALFIKKTIEKKIAFYDSLDFEEVSKGFFEWIQGENFKTFREMPPKCKVKVYLNDLIKNFLIKCAYYTLADKYIQRRIMKKLVIFDPDDIRVLEIGDFIRNELEKDGLSSLKAFDERSKFKYFLGMVVTRLLYDFWRHHYATKKHVTRFGPEFDALFERPTDDPLDQILKSEDEEVKRQAAEVLPSILESLGPKEKLSIKWKYEDGMTISALARAFGHTRYKTEKFVEELEQKIAKEIFKNIVNKKSNKGEKNDPPER
jgi:RNA polymerase sigma factor (sigma-70 family)